MLRPGLKVKFNSNIGDVWAHLISILDQYSDNPVLYVMVDNGMVQHFYLQVYKNSILEVADENGQLIMFW